MRTTTRLLLLLLLLVFAHAALFVAAQGGGGEEEEADATTTNKQDINDRTFGANLSSRAYAFWSAVRLSTLPPSTCENNPRAAMY